MFFRRRARKRLGEPDPSFPGMTRGRADELRTALRKAVADSGATARFDGMHGIIEHPRRGRVTLNLENLVDDVARSQHPRAAATMARSFVAAMLDDRGADILDTAELYAGLRLRVAPTTGLVPEESEIVTAASLHAFTADTAVTLVLDTEHSIRTMPLERLRPVDDLDTLVRAARTNLREELLGAPVVAQRHPGSEEHPGARFWSFESGSYYIASAPILIEDVLTSWAPGLDRSLGVLFAMPTRHVLLAREVTLGDDLLEGLGRMAPVAAQLAISRPHTVSPLLHLFHDGEVSTLSTFDQEARQLQISPTPYLLELMSQR
ncbi:hypothetical protein [Corynebacterium halotolerans]|uniref:Uncharacterized protein n=1 Tax=Corynebacterium halotolerans YIM 70093 = DSM 44683 TaxID=1121362 RepID=M1MWB3_9CORY|nr:hypothetical protein [Corynebacterium halotolerans]AGF72009.1 hypothetical protein A605_05015 [Corynebacterium halotolerans YIM 70093 = DSM 44683]